MVISVTTAQTSVGVLLQPLFKVMTGKPVTPEYLAEVITPQLPADVNDITLKYVVYVPDIKKYIMLEAYADNTEPICRFSYWIRISESYPRSIRDMQGYAIEFDSEFHDKSRNVVQLWDSYNPNGYRIPYISACSLQHIFKNMFKDNEFTAAMKALNIIEATILAIRSQLVANPFNRVQIPAKVIEVEHKVLTSANVRYLLTYENLNGRRVFLLTKASNGNSITINPYTLTAEIVNGASNISLADAKLYTQLTIAEALNLMDVAKEIIRWVV